MKTDTKIIQLDLMPDNGFKVYYGDCDTLKLIGEIDPKNQPGICRWVYHLEPEHATQIKEPKVTIKMGDQEVDEKDFAGFETIGGGEMYSSDAKPEIAAIKTTQQKQHEKALLEAVRVFMFCRISQDHSIKNNIESTSAIVKSYLNSLSTISYWEPKLGERVDVVGKCAGDWARVYPYVVGIELDKSGNKTFVLSETISDGRTDGWKIENLKPAPITINLKEVK